MKKEKTQFKFIWVNKGSYMFYSLILILLIDKNVPTFGPHFY